MNIRSIASVFVAIVAVFALSFWCYPRSKLKPSLRENPAALMPHRQEAIAKGILSISDESYKQAIQNMMVVDTRTAERSTWIQINRPDTLVVSQYELLEVLSDRRGLKLTQMISEMPENNRAKATRDAFEAFRTSHEKDLYSKWMKTDDGGDVYRGCRALGWSLVNTSLLGTPPELLRQIEQVRKSGDSFLAELRDKQPNRTYFGRDLLYHVYPDNRLLMNSILFALRRLKLESVCAALVRDFPKKKVPIGPWDAPVTYFESNDNGFLLNMDEKLPSFVDLNNGWHEFVIYDWPYSWNADEDRDKQLVSLNLLIDELRKVARKSE